MTEQPKVLVAKVRLDDIRFHPANIRRDLGDLRQLTDSIRRYGVMQPIIVEKYGNAVRLRAGHRRTAAARLANVRSIPAVVHRDVLDDDEFVMQALHENTMRRGLTDDERRAALQALRDAGCTVAGIAESLHVSATTITKWLQPDEVRRHKAHGKRVNATALRRVVTDWRQRAESGLTAAEATQLLDDLARLSAA